MATHRARTFVWVAALALVASDVRAESQVVQFDAYSPLVADAELARRMFTPLQYVHLLDELMAPGRARPSHTVDLAEERFDLFVPERQPAKGYGLLVFVSPMPSLPVPSDWKYSLNRAGVIYVAARRSGNDQDVFLRRAPLALHAYENIRQRYPLDPERVWVAGYSGGGKVAIRVAASFPDVFRGAMLVAGSMMLGELGFAPPPENLMTLFQQRSRLAFATGALDLPNIGIDLRSREALRDNCVFALRKLAMPRVGHDLPDARAFAAALNFIDRQPEPPTTETERCRAKLQAEAEHLMAGTEADFAAGEIGRVGAKLQLLSDRYGGLLHDRIIALRREMLYTGRAE